MNSFSSFTSSGSLTAVTKLNISLDNNTEFTSMSGSTDTTLRAGNSPCYSSTPVSDSTSFSSSCPRENITSLLSECKNDLTSSDINLCSKPSKGPVRRRLNFNEKSRKRYSRKYKEINHHSVQQNQINCSSRCSTAPLACSTMIDFSINRSVDNDTSHDISTFHPAGSSTQVIDNEFIPCVSSTMVEKSAFTTTQNNTVDNNSRLTGIELWSINENEETLMLQENYNRQHGRLSESTCCTRDLLSTIAATTICRDEFSLDQYYQDAPFINEYKTLPRTSTVTQMNNNKVKTEEECCNTKTEEMAVCKKQQKQRQTIFKLMQVMKNVKKGFSKKQSNDQKLKLTSDTVEQIKPEMIEPVVPEVRIQDKQAVARKLHRFRQSFRRKDVQQLQTLATL